MSLVAISETVEMLNAQQPSLTEDEKQFVVQFAFKTGDRELTNKLIDELTMHVKDSSIIMKKYATTGDGILTALMIAEEICDSKTSLAKLAEPIHFYPQYLQNIRVKDKAAVLVDKNVLKEMENVEKLIDGKGRALLRQSGTEPLIRVMIESETQEQCVEYAEMVVKAILEGGHGVE